MIPDASWTPSGCHVLGLPAQRPGVQRGAGRYHVDRSGKPFCRVQMSKWPRSRRSAGTPCWARRPCRITALDCRERACGRTRLTIRARPPALVCRNSPSDRAENRRAPNGLAFRCRERAARDHVKNRTISREAVSWYAGLGGAGGRHVPHTLRRGMRASSPGKGTSSPGIGGRRESTDCRGMRARTGTHACQYPRQLRCARDCRAARHARQPPKHAPRVRIGRATRRACQPRKHAPHHPRHRPQVRMGRPPRHGPRRSSDRFRKPRSGPARPTSN